MSFSPTRTRDAEGFTLIELLIVVVIIGILAAIAIPQFSSTKGAAYDAAAKADLRNAMSAEETYFATDNEYATFTASDGGTATVGTGGPVVNASDGVTVAGTGGASDYTITAAHGSGGSTWCVNTDPTSTSGGEIVEGTSC